MKLLRGHFLFASWVKSFRKQETSSLRLTKNISSTQTPTSWMWNAQAATGSPRWMSWHSFEPNLLGWTHHLMFLFILLSIIFTQILFAGVLARSDSRCLLGMFHRALPVHWGSGKANWRCVWKFELAFELSLIYFRMLLQKEESKVNFSGEISLREEGNKFRMRSGWQDGHDAKI